LDKRGKGIASRLNAHGLALERIDVHSRGSQALCGMSAIGREIGFFGFHFTRIVLPLGLDLLNFFLKPVYFVIDVNGLIGRFPCARNAD
jgi:hypothetical protein